VQLALVRNDSTKAAEINLRFALMRFACSGSFLLVERADNIKCMPRSRTRQEEIHQKCCSRLVDKTRENRHLKKHLASPKHENKSKSFALFVLAKQMWLSGYKRMCVRCAVLFLTHARRRGRRTERRHGDDS
jgi:hypothetical protein